VAFIVQVILDLKHFQIKQALDACESLKRDKTQAGSQRCNVIIART